VSKHYFHVAKASLTFCVFQFSSTAFAPLARRISRGIGRHFSYTHRRLSRLLAHWISRRIARHFSYTRELLSRSSLIGFLVGLHVTSLLLVDGSRGGLLVKLGISFLPPTNLYPNGLHAAFVVE